ncbi:hypothetical protein WS73_00320 [Burkholderia savannae]|nr:hypothetical protein WS73_00320 [Burkholderia savannae]
MDDERWVTGVGVGVERRIVEPIGGRCVAPRLQVHVGRLAAVAWAAQARLEAMDAMRMATASKRGRRRIGDAWQATRSGRAACGAQRVA